MSNGKFSKVAAKEQNSNWNKLINRQHEIYGRPDDIRSAFARDYTRILHSLAYRRLKHKTQVFFNAAGNDHICTRIEHVSHVASVSNTIAKYLGLNEELTKAIALAHDLGHAPFGHQGEEVIKKITKEEIGQDFWHEKNGLYFVDKVELLEDPKKNLKNLDLTYAVRDGIISHCGELDENAIKPRNELFKLDNFKEKGQYQASTWEGCVVKISDKIAYLGRDIEDAIRLNYLEKKDLEVLHNMAKLHDESYINTTVIMHNMIIDLCNNSSVEKGLCLSNEMAQQLKAIKTFNYEKIYNNKRLNTFKKYSKIVINELFETLKEMYKGEDTIAYYDKNISQYKPFVREFMQWLVQYCDIDFSQIQWAEDITKRCENIKIYGDLNDKSMYIQAVIDYIAGMTDNYAINAFNQLLEC